MSGLIRMRLSKLEVRIKNKVLKGRILFMAGYDHSTIVEFVKRVEQGEIILPAMQRDFVWKKDKIYALFESLMREYPIGTFIAWRVNRDLVGKYPFNSFIKDFDERSEYTKKERVSSDKYSLDNYLAVLDGQQRITSLVMGLIGSYTEKTKQKNKADGSHIYQKCYLCIDILHEKKEPSQPQYKFQFIPEKQCEQFDETGVSYWVPVRSVIGDDVFLSDIVDKAKVSMPANMKSLPGNPNKQLELLRRALADRLNIYYYTAQCKDLSEVIEIFIRVNSQGKALEASDLILSSATANIFEEDIHEIIRVAVSDLNDTTTSDWITKDFILQTGLMCIESETLSFGSAKVYRNQETLKDIFVNKWQYILKAIRLAITFVEHIGFKGMDIPKSILCVLAYYFYQKPELKLNYVKLKQSTHDRILIRQWILRAIINSVFVDGTGSTLLRIRKLLSGNCQKDFPLQLLLDADDRRSFKIDESAVDSILKFKFSEKRTLPLLAEISGYVDVTEKETDHIFARSNIVTKKNFKSLYLGDADPDKMQAEYKARLEYLPNLQLLDKSANASKGATLYHEWVKSLSSDMMGKQLLPTDQEYAFEDFIQFCESRSALLRTRLLEVFPNTVDKIFKNHGI